MTRVDHVLEQLDSHGLSRRRFLRLAGAATAALSSAGVLAACGGGSRSAAATDGKFAFLAWSTLGDYPQQLGDGFKAAAQQLGHRAVVLDGKGDAAVQQNQFNQLLTQKTAAILTGLNDPGVLPTFARDVGDRGVLLNAAWNSPGWYTPWGAPSDDYNAFLLPDVFESISKSIDVLAKTIGEEGTVVRVGGYWPSKDGAELQRRRAVHETLAKYPKIKLAAELFAKYDPDLSQRAAATLLARFPDTVGIIADDDAATGVVAAIEAAGKTPGRDVHVVGFSGSPAGIERVAAGTQLVTAATLGAYPAFVSVAQFHDRLNGWKPETAERIFGWHSAVLTKDNVAAYRARYVEGHTATSFNAKLLSRTEHPDDFDLQAAAYPVEDLDALWPGLPRPKDFTLPDAYVKAQRNGDFDRIRALYAKHYKTPALAPAPAPAA